MAGGRKREWIRKKMATVAAGSTLRAGAAFRLRRRRVDLLRVLYDNVVFRLLWALESMVVLSKLCFFFLRFGFRL